MAPRCLPNLTSLRDRGNVRFALRAEVPDTLGTKHHAHPTPVLQFESARKTKDMSSTSSLILESSRHIPATSKQADWLKQLHMASSSPYLPLIVFATTGVSFFEMPVCRLEDALRRYEYEPSYRFRDTFPRVAFVMQVVADVTDALLRLHHQHKGVHGALTLDSIVYTRDGRWTLQLDLQMTRESLQRADQVADLDRWAHIVDSEMMARVLPEKHKILQHDATQTILRRQTAGAPPRINRICSFRDLDNWRGGGGVGGGRAPSGGSAPSDPLNESTVEPPVHLTLMGFFLWFVYAMNPSRMVESRAFFQHDDSVDSTVTKAPTVPLMYSPYLTEQLALF